MGEDKRQETKSEEFIRTTMEHLMGEVLDIARISDMGERQQTQFEKTAKNKFNNYQKLYKDKLILKEEKA